MFKPTDKMFSKVLRTIFYRINKQENPFKPSFQKTIAIPEGMFCRNTLQEGMFCKNTLPEGMFFRKPEEIPGGMFFRKPEGMFFKNEPWINQFSMVNICSDLID